MSLLINSRLPIDDEEVKDMSIRERLQLVPRSYDDFVNYTARYMDQNDELKSIILEFIETHPEANSGEVLEVLVDFLGLGEPLEIVDDDISLPA